MSLSTVSNAFNLQRLRDVACELDTEAERLTELLALSFNRPGRLRNRVVERRALLWRTAKLLREIAPSPPETP